MQWSCYPVCNVPVQWGKSGLQPPYGNSWKSIWLCREVGRVLTQLLADQQTLRKAPKPLVTPVVPLKACWLNRTEMSCYFSHLSAVTDRGEFDESLIPPTITWCGDSGYMLRILDSRVPTISWCGDSGYLLWAAYRNGQQCLKVACSQTSS